jgi:hypothetical protein
MRGKINDFDFGADGQIDQQGNFMIVVPRGLTDGIVGLATPHIPSTTAFMEGYHRQPKWRTDRDKPFVTGEIPIGRVDIDTSGIEIVYPDPPKPAAAAFPAGPAPAAGEFPGGRRARGPATPPAEAK